jgi:hypothetical protein
MRRLQELGGRFRFPERTRPQGGRTPIGGIGA